eukprot:TRINITY_DN704_c0_g1_i1.p1 TRINITY_DN704_c0_g1~~TRINITY_DN704_c0_g1_i1.p1  ORF type:complete len:766 (+),score=302.01 TRINITY_DN704_c0_g1_i1:78-2300(+)
MAEPLEVICSGYLVGGRPKEAAKIKRRWYELYNGAMHIFDTRGGDWKGAVRVTPDTTADQGEPPGGFVITFPQLSRPFEMQADSSEDRDRWLQALRSSAAQTGRWEQERRRARERPEPADPDWLQGFAMDRRKQPAPARPGRPRSRSARGEEDGVEMGELSTSRPPAPPPPPPTVDQLLGMPFERAVRRWPGFDEWLREAGAPVRRKWGGDWGEGAAAGLRDALSDLIQQGRFDTLAAGATPDHAPLSPTGGEPGSPLLDDDGVQFCEASLTPQQMAIVALNDDDGKWEMDAGAAAAVFKMIDTDGSGELTLEELLAAVDSKEVKKFLLECNQPVLRGLLDPDMLNDAFAALDEDGSGTISALEWNSFIEEVGRKRLAYLEGKAHLTGQCYWGYGSALAGEKGMDPCGLVSSKKLPRGWLDDFWYFTKNNHPLIALALVDPDHPLSLNERAALEFVTQGFSFMMSGMYDWRDHSGDGGAWDFFWHPTVFSIVFVTIPGMILMKVMFMLYTCPLKTCWVDESSAEPQDIARMHKFHKMGHYTSVLFICGAMLFYALGIFMYFLDPSSVDPTRLQLWLQGRLQAYVMWFVTTLAMPFNPLMAKKIGPIVLGTWELQRRRVRLLLTEWATIPEHDAFPEQTGETMELRSASEGDDPTKSAWDTDLLAAKVHCLEGDFDGFVAVGFPETGGEARFKNWGRAEDGSVIRQAAVPCPGRCIYYRKPPKEKAAAEGYKEPAAPPVAL